VGLYRKARESWTVVCFEEMITWAQNREGHVIADFGCGEALCGKAASESHTIHSFDHVAISEGVLAADMANTPPPGLTIATD
jgi:predicted TPR repeat methyltransferase